MKKSLIGMMLLAVMCTTAEAKITVNIDALPNSNLDVTGTIGSVTFENTRQGLLITPNLAHLTPGIHGFHIHEKSSCANNGDAAGGHLDPRSSKEHNGPYKTLGHLGDLPALYVDAAGNATLPTLAPKITEQSLVGHSLMIHAGGDNYSDQPNKLGGGGARIACGAIAK